MKRERIAWIVSVVLLAILAFSLPGSFAQRDDDYAFVRTLVDIHRQVVSNYVDPVDEQALNEKAIEGMLSPLDPFTVYVPPSKQEAFDNLLEGSFKGVGIQLNQLDDGRVEVITPIEGSPAFRAGVMAGDIIEKVNGAALDPNMRLPEIVKKIAGPAGSEVTLLLKHTDGREQTVTMKREEIVVPTVKGYQRNPDDTWDFWVSENPKIGYIRITQFTPDTTDEVKKALLGGPAENGKPSIAGLMDQGMKGLILDLRFNPGGRLDQARDILNMFLKEGQVIVSTKGRARPEQVFKADGKDTLPNFPMIVLVNEHSASAAEIVSGSLMDNHRALVMGQRTYGKGSVQELIPLESNSGELKLTVAYYYLPSGRLVHRKKDSKDWGVVPQIIVPMDDQTEQKLMEWHVQQETVRKPIPKPVAQVLPSTQPTTEPSQPADVQLQQAMTTMLGLLVLDAGKNNGATWQAVPPAPTTHPTTEPSQAP